MSWWSDVSEWWDGVDLDQGIFESDEEQERERNVRENIRRRRDVREDDSLDARGRRDKLDRLKRQVEGRGTFEKITDTLFRTDDYEAQKILDASGDIEEYDKLVREEDELEKEEQKDEEGVDELRDLFFDQIDSYIDRDEDLRDSVRDYERDALRIQRDEEKLLNEVYDDRKKKLGIADDILDQSVAQGEEYARSGSVADEVLKDSLFASQAGTAQAYAGRTGGGYLKDFERARALNQQKLADTGSAARMQEEQEKMRFLSDLKGAASSNLANRAQNTPTQLLALMQDAGRFGLQNRQASDQRLQALNMGQRNFMNQLQAWKGGNQNFASSEQNTAFQQGMQDRQARLASEAGGRENAKLRWDKQQYYTDKIQDTAKDIATAFNPVAKKDKK